MANIKILIVEDESIVAKDIQNRLKKFGYDVPFIASSGAEAIKRVTEMYPDLILMDIRIKGDIDGVETARQIHAQYSVPVVYLTAYADDNTLDRAKLTDPSGYLLKPFKERELYTAVEIALNKYRMERQLKESQKWLTTVLKSISDAVITSDINNCITFMNPVAEALTDWKQSDVLGRDVAEIFQIANEETRDPVESPVTKALQLGIVVSLPEKTVLIARNGAEIPIDDSAAPIRDDGGNIAGTVLVFRDITERKQAESARQQQNVQELMVAELERLNQLKDEFLSTVSHELRTPMTNMKMAIQMLKVASNVDQLQCYLEILQAECNREIELINNILDLQRLEVSSSSLFNAEAIALQDWLPSILGPFINRAQERQQTLRVNLPAELHIIIADRSSLERILAELLNNACKYTSAGGEIILSVSCSLYQLRTSQLAPVPSDSATVTIFTISNQAEIPAAELPRIFDKFYRVPKGDIWKQGGTGLGLALVQKLVEQLQGTIQVESGDGWTTFTVQLIPLVINVDL